MSALPPPFLPPGQQHAGCATLQPGGAGASSAAAGQRRGAAPRQAGGGWQQAAGAARGAHLAVRARAEHLQAAVVARLQPDVVRVHLQPPRHSENAQARRRCLCRLHWDLADSARSLGMQGWQASDLLCFTSCGPILGKDASPGYPNPTLSGRTRWTAARGSWRAARGRPTAWWCRPGRAGRPRRRRPSRARRWSRC